DCGAGQPDAVSWYVKVRAAAAGSQEVAGYAQLVRRGNAGDGGDGAEDQVLVFERARLADVRDVARHPVRDSADGEGHGHHAGAVQDVGGDLEQLEVIFQPGFFLE